MERQPMPDPSMGKENRPPTDFEIEDMQQGVEEYLAHVETQKAVEEEVRAGENDAYLDIMEMQDAGKTNQEIIDRFGGFEGLERVIGTKAARGFVEDAENELKGDK